MRSLLPSPGVTRTGRRLTPLMASIGLGAMIAVVAATTGPLAHPSPINTDPLAVSAAQVPAAVIAQPALPLIPEPPSPHRRRSSSGGSHLRGPAAEVLSLTNEQRSKAGCHALTVDTDLTRVAQQHSSDMARRSYFSHTDQGGNTWEKRQISSGFSAEKTGGENIARGPSSAEEVMNGWMHSPEHRRNILDCRFTTIGIGYTAKGNYWTQDFGY